MQNYLRSEQLKGHENKTQSEVLDGILEQKEIPEEEKKTLVDLNRWDTYLIVFCKC